MEMKHSGDSVLYAAHTTSHGDYFGSSVGGSTGSSGLILRITAVPQRPEDGTVPVVVLFAIESSCVTDCNFNLVRCPCNEPVRQVSP